MIRIWDCPGNGILPRVEVGSCCGRGESGGLLADPEQHLQARVGEILQQVHRTPGRRWPLRPGASAIGAARPIVMPLGLWFGG